MTELEKLDAGLPFDVNDPEVDARKLHAVMSEIVKKRKKRFVSFLVRSVKIRMSCRVFAVITDSIS